MKRISRTFFSLLLLSVLITCFGCFYDKEEILYPSNCDVSAVTYSVTVTGILSANCYSCHNTANGPTSGSGIVFDTYAKLKPYATNGRLLGAINHAGGYSPMPKNMAQLNSCDLAKIQAWVTAGTPEN
jgi:uncharacterized membrane protein